MTSKFYRSIVVVLRKCSLFFFNVSHSVYGTLQSVLQGTQQLAQVIMGASHLVQWAIPAALSSTGEEQEHIMRWKQEWHHKLQQQACAIEQVLRQSPYLQVYPPRGGMYLMVRIDADHMQKADSEWTRELLQEENVLALPGSCFGMTKDNGFFRIVFGAPTAVLEEAGQRIVSFLERTMDNIPTNKHT